MYQMSSSPSAKELGACGLRGWAKAAATASALRSPDANTHVRRERAIMGTVSVTRSGGGFGDALTDAIETAASNQDWQRAWQLSQLYAFVYARPDIQNGKLCWIDTAGGQRKRSAEF